MKILVGVDKKYILEEAIYLYTKGEITLAENNSTGKFGVKWSGQYEYEADEKTVREFNFKLEQISKLADDMNENGIVFSYKQDDQSFYSNVKWTQMRKLFYENLEFNQIPMIIELLKSQSYRKEKTK